MKYAIYKFKRAELRKHVYEVISSPPSGYLDFVLLTEPKSNYLISQGAKWVLESYENNSKKFFTGLLQVAENIFVGDALDKNGGRHLIEVQLLADGKELILVIYAHDLPNNAARRKFVLKKIEGCGSNAASPYQVQTNMTKQISHD